MCLSLRHFINAHHNKDVFVLWCVCSLCVKNVPTYQKGSSNPADDLPEIVTADLEACNGVIHVVDKVLLPMPLPYPMETSTSTEEETMDDSMEPTGAPSTTSPEFSITGAPSVPATTTNNDTSTTDNENCESIRTLKSILYLTHSIDSLTHSLTLNQSILVLFCWLHHQSSGYCLWFVRLFYLVCVLGDDHVE
jgi:hypothetical protein